MEVSALKLSGGAGLHGRSPLLRLQSDERLVVLVRRGNAAAFELLVARYQTRLLAFCRHMLGSHEDAQDVLQEVFAAAYNAILGDDRPINVRPWLYRIARNRCLNQMRRAQAVGVDSMDIHFSDFGASTADKVQEREQFRELVSDIADLPETQRTALVLREMDALSYEQIADAMETTVPSVKSLLVRARVGLAEASEARMLSCEEVRAELGAIAEGLIGRPTPPVRRHLKSCRRCDAFQARLKQTNKALAAILPIGPLMVLRQFAFMHLPHSAGSSATAAGTGAGTAGASAAGTTVAGSTVAAGTTIAVGSSASSLVSAGVGALATKAVAGLAAAALVTAGAVAVDRTAHTHKPARAMHAEAAVAQTLASGASQASSGSATLAAPIAELAPLNAGAEAALIAKQAAHKHATLAAASVKATTTTTATTTTAVTTTTARTTTTTSAASTTTSAPGRVDTTAIPTVLPTGATTTPVTATAPTSTTPASTTTPTTPTSSTTAIQTSTTPSTATPADTTTTPGATTTTTSAPTSTYTTTASSQTDTSATDTETTSADTSQTG
jgi:RNA polymerase sigma factor (sigma-70 family)